MIITKRTLSIFLTFLLIFSLTSCSSEYTGGSSTDGVSIEDGWTINEDGNFVYAVVLENTSDKVLKKGTIFLKALDKEGNVLNLKGEGSNWFGNVYPGEKTAFILDSFVSDENGSSLFKDVPVSFEYELRGTDWGDSSKLPDISIIDSDKIDTYGYTNCYSFTLKNNSDIDFDWQEVIDNSNNADYLFDVYEIIRNDEGKIVGGSCLYLYLYEKNGYPFISAGEEISTEGSGYLENTVFENNDNYELITRWIVL